MHSSAKKRLVSLLYDRPFTQDEVILFTDVFEGDFFPLCITPQDEKRETRTALA